jgi:hypothetical protein
MTPKSHRNDSHSKSPWFFKRWSDYKTHYSAYRIQPNKKSVTFAQWCFISQSDSFLMHKHIGSALHKNHNSIYHQCILGTFSLRQSLIDMPVRRLNALRSAAPLEKPQKSGIEESERLGL